MRQAMMFSKRGTSAAEVQAAIADRLRYPAWIAGTWYDVRAAFGGTGGQAAIAANTLYASPIWIPRDGVPVDRIGINVSTAGAASSVARLMLHRDDGNGLPGALILDAGTVPVDTTGDKEITIALTLPGGLIFGSIVSNGGPTIQVASNGLALYGHATAAAVNLRGSASRAFTFGAAPDPWGTPTAFATNSHYRIALRAA